MPDREKVVKELECIRDWAQFAVNKRWLVAGASEKMVKYAEDALELLKAQELTDQDRNDLDIIHRIRAGKSLKVVNGAYTIVNEAWRKEHPWAMPVRCKDCEYFIPNNTEEDDWSGRCTNAYVPMNGTTVDGWWFCADGKRRDDGAAD